MPRPRTYLGAVLFTVSADFFSTATRFARTILAQPLPVATTVGIATTGSIRPKVSASASFGVQAGISTTAARGTSGVVSATWLLGVTTTPSVTKTVTGSASLTAIFETTTAATVADGHLSIEYVSSGSYAMIGWSTVTGASGYRVVFEQDSATAEVAPNCSWWMVEALGPGRTEHGVLRLAGSTGEIAIQRTANANCDTLQWDPVSGATGYRVTFEFDNLSAAVAQDCRWWMVEALGSGRKEHGMRWAAPSVKGKASLSTTINSSLSGTRTTAGSIAEEITVTVGSAGTVTSSSTVSLSTNPPGWNGGDVMNSSSFPGYTVVDSFEACTDANTDYYVRPQNISIQSTLADNAGYTVAARVTGGRNVVSFGGTIDVEPVSLYDDAINLIVEQGNSTGTVHIEGYRFPRGVNIVTVRTARKIQLVYNRIDKSYIPQNDHITGGCHPDLVQIWANGPANLVTEYLSAGYSFTGLTALTSPDPASWTMDHVYVYALPLEPNSIKTVKGWDVAGGNVTYFGDQHVTDYSFNECWCIPGDEDGGATRRLQDVLTYGQTVPAYTVTGTGRDVGDTISWPTVPLLADGHWTLGTPDWDVPADSVGYGVYAGRS